MQVVFNHFDLDTPIPVNDYIENRKMAKYYNREAQAAMVSICMLLNKQRPDPNTPIFYAVGIIEHEEFDIHKIASHSAGESGKFSTKAFIDKGIMQISPLTQFKILYNMTLCFISIEYGFKGDNAVIYSSAAGLINNALYANTDSAIIIGSGKIDKNGNVESGFASITKQEIAALPKFDSDTEAIELFKYLKSRN
jgi:hypothetical protein